MKKRSLQIKFMLYAMAAVTAAILLALGSGVILDGGEGGALYRYLFRFQVATGGVIWIASFIFAFLFSRFAAAPAERLLRQQKKAVADVSHELKTPLSVIAADAALLEQNCGGRSEDWDRWLEHMNAECRQMTAMIDGLLAVAREDEKSRFLRKKFDLSSLVTEKLLVFEPLFYQEKKQLDFQVEDGIFMKGNPDQIGQAVQALLENSVKYSPEEGRIQVSLEKKGSFRVRLWVNSQGSPIPLKSKAMIFRRYYREEGKKERGSGLGLSIAGEIIKAHKGKAGVEYREGMNCFYLELPAYGSRHNLLEALYKAVKSCV